MICLGSHGEGVTYLWLVSRPLHFRAVVLSMTRNYVSTFVFRHVLFENKQTQNKLCQWKLASGGDDFMPADGTRCHLAEHLALLKGAFNNALNDVTVCRLTGFKPSGCDGKANARALIRPLFKVAARASVRLALCRENECVIISIPLRVF